jgi:hypothetical protein
MWEVRWNRHLMADKRLLASHRAIAAYVMTRSHRDHGGCWEAHATIADVMGCDAKTVSRALSRAVELGWLTCRRRKQDTNVYAPAMPPEFGGAWPTGRAQERTLTSDLESLEPGQDRTPMSELGDQDRTPMSEGDRTPMSTNTELRTGLKNTPSKSAQLHHPRQRGDEDAAPADGWPRGSWRDHEAELLRLLSVKPGSLTDGHHRLTAWRRGGVPWGIVRSASLNTILKAPRPVRSFGYFDAEIRAMREEVAMASRDGSLEVAASKFSEETIAALAELRRRQLSAGDADPAVVQLMKPGRQKRGASAVPTEIIDAVAAVTSEDFAYSWLAQASWADVPAKTITPAGPTAFERLTRERNAMRVLKELAIELRSPLEKRASNG